MKTERYMKISGKSATGLLPNYRFINTYVHIMNIYVQLQTIAVSFTSLVKNKPFNCSSLEGVVINKTFLQEDFLITGYMRVIRVVATASIAWKGFEKGVSERENKEAKV